MCSDAEDLIPRLNIVSEKYASSSFGEILKELSTYLVQLRNCVLKLGEIFTKMFNIEEAFYRIAVSLHCAGKAGDILTGGFMRVVASYKCGCNSCFFVHRRKKTNLVRV